MNILNKLTMSNDINDHIKSLKDYMFYNIQYDNNIKVDNSKTNIITGDKIVPRFLKVVDYNKTRCKYNENTDKYKQKYDELFWLFYKLYYNKEDDDLLGINLFLEEKNKKIELVMNINSTKINIKSANTTKIHIIEDLTNSNKIDIYTFNALCLIFNIDILLIKNNKLYTFISNKSNEKFKQLQNFNVLKINFHNSSNLSKSYNIVFSLESNDFINSLDNYYYAKNIMKPLKSVSSYKVDELIEIAVKLNIVLNEDNKKKTKQKLYNEILDKLE